MQCVLCGFFFLLSELRKYGCVGTLVAFSPYMEYDRDVLMVDDEMSFLVAARRLLGKLDLSVDLATSCTAAETLLKEHCYRVLLLDLCLSGSGNMDGFVLLEEVRRSSPATAVLVISAYGNDETRRRVVEKGAVAFVEKPVEMNLLKRKVLSLCRKEVGSMKVSVDESTCVGCGVCASMCPDIFEVEGAVAVVKVQEVPSDQEDCCREAADACPVDAISVS